jgi:hypothetical protein
MEAHSSRVGWYAPAMKDQRLKVFRGALEGLIESLDALVRVSRWSEADPPPDPLRTAAAKLLDRLGTAGRLSSGTPTDTTKVNAMFATMRRLDVAYVSYRKRVESAPEQAGEAAATLEAEIAEATAGATEWH